MASTIYNFSNTYAVFAEDTAFGTPGVPTGSDFIDKVSTFTGAVANNSIIVHGIGEGRAAQDIVNGILDVNGSMEWELTDPSFLQYCIGAERIGAGTAGDPYEIQEVDLVGYSAGEMPTLTLEFGSEGGANDDVTRFDGVVFNTFTLNAIQGETVKCLGDWLGRTVNSSTTALTYTGPANRPFTFVEGSATIGSDAIGQLVSFSLVCTNNIFTFRTMGTRLIGQPVAGPRRYEFTIVVKTHYESTASILDSQELRSLAFDGTTSSTTPTEDAENTAVAISLDLVEGAGSGDRVINIDLERCFIDSVSQPRSFADGVFETTITGFAISGLTDSSEKVPIRWWTIA